MTINGFLIGRLDLLMTYTHHSELPHIITALPLIYTLYSSPFTVTTHTSVSQSTLVVSWQEIYNSLIVTTAHNEVFFAQPNAISSQSSSTAVSRDSINYSNSSWPVILVI
jgi:hypothetical protein